MTDSSATTAGILYIVATPIGNREDITLRAISTLQSVDFILAEDTRHSGQLLSHLNIKKPLVSLHAHNEASKNDYVIDLLNKGQSCALISDAGTPLISDPGFLLVRAARKSDIKVVPIPGASALITALSAAGVAADTFTFSGFLPAKHLNRVEKLKKLTNIKHTLIFYESTHRIIESIEDIALIFGENCELLLAKELTKTFENFISGSCNDVKSWLLSDLNHCKGEFVLIIPPRQEEAKPEENTNLLKTLLAELPLKQAVKIASTLTGGNKNELYKLALTLQS